MSSEENGAYTALKSERKIRKLAERQRDNAIADLARVRHHLADAESELRHWRRRAEDRGAALTHANQTTSVLARALDERLTND